MPLAINYKGMALQCHPINNEVFNMEKVLVDQNAQAAIVEFLTAAGVKKITDQDIRTIWKALKEVFDRHM